MNPPAKLKKKVAINRAIARGQPREATLRKKISGSIEGEAIQKDITAPSGTPAMSREVMTGITLQEQKGLNAPMIVPSNMDKKAL
jgi:hypothetical protein